ncbi:MAG: hypothetical protein R3B72_26780 [Polyangiaceae bacterium]
MRSLALGAVACVTTALFFSAACSDGGADISGSGAGTGTGTATGSGSGGGTGTGTNTGTGTGTSTGTSTGTNTGTTTGTATGAGGGGAGGAGGGGVCGNGPHVCADACCHMETECAIPGACGLADQNLGTDLTNCGDAYSQCVAGCFEPAACAAITSLLGQNPDQGLITCLAGCSNQGTGGGGMGGAGGGTMVSCFDCATSSCNAQIAACQNDTGCTTFANCALMCTDGDGTCLNNCAAMQPNNGAVAAVMACLMTNCQGPCGL